MIELIVAYVLLDATHLIAVNLCDKTKNKCTNIDLNTTKTQIDIYELVMYKYSALVRALDGTVI